MVENFTFKLAEVLREGPIASKVHEVHVGPAFVTDEGLNWRRTRHPHGRHGYALHVGRGNRSSGQDHMGTHLDDLKLTAIHRDLRATLRVAHRMMREVVRPASLKFIGGLINIDNNGSKDTIRRGQASAAC